MVVKILQRSAKGISSSSSLPQQQEEQEQFSYHQCTKCGMIYRCEKDSCKMPFLYDICHMCQKRRSFYFNFWRL